MTTAAAGNVAGHSAENDKNKEKEKPGMRRALGRGLASLLPGPRAVPPAAAAPATVQPAKQPAGVAPQPVISQVGASHAVEPAPHPVSATSAGAAPASSASSHSESASADVTRAGASAPPLEIYAVADETVYPEQPGDAEEKIEINAAAARRPRSPLMALAIADIDRNPFQTRQVEDDDALEELANSIKTQGVVQPIVVRKSPEEKGRYILILGERRLVASKKAGKAHIPAIVREVSEQQAAEMTIIENLQRQDLSPLQQAEAFRVLSTNFNLTQEEIGKRVGLSRASVANYMRLLKLPVGVMEMLATKVINFAQAKELLKLEDNDRIGEAAIYAVKKGMSLEQIEMLVLRMDGLLDPLPDMPGVKKKDKASGGARWVDPNVRSAQMDLERTLGLRVRIRDRKGKGKIVIEYSTVDDYERVVEMLRKR